MAGNEIKLFLIWIALLTVLSLLLFGWDKLSARTGWRRVPESTLLLVALLGGSIGARLAQKLFRHKTRKQPFARKLRAILILHGVCFIFVSAGALGGLFAL